MTFFHKHILFYAAKNANIIIENRKTIVAYYLVGGGGGVNESDGANALLNLMELIQKKARKVYKTAIIVLTMRH